MPTIYLNPILPSKKAKPEDVIKDVVRAVNRNNQAISHMLSGQFNYVNTQEAAFLQTWQDSTQDDVDGENPIEVPIYLPVETQRLHTCLLRLKIGQFRSTAKSATAGEAVSTTSGASSASTTAGGGGTTVTSGASSSSTTADGGGSAPTSGPSSASTTVSGGSINQSSGSSSSSTTVSGGDTATGGWGNVYTTENMVEAEWGTTGGPDGHQHNYMRGQSHHHTVPYHAHTIAGNHSHGMSHTHNITVSAHSHGMDHTHTVTIGAHTHGMTHTHGVTLSNHSHGMSHTHQVDIPGHNHDLIYGIYKADAAVEPGLTITINGVDRTAALGGPFHTGQDSLNVTPYVEVGEWNVVEIGCATGKLVRVQASLFVQAFMSPVGRLEPEQ